MRIDSGLIRSVEIMNKSDGRRIRVWYVEPESSMSKEWRETGGKIKRAWRKTGDNIKRAWRNEVIRTMTTAATMVVLLELIKAMAGM